MVKTNLFGVCGKRVIFSLVFVVLFTFVGPVGPGSFVGLAYAKKQAEGGEVKNLARKKKASGKSSGKASSLLVKRNSAAGKAGKAVGVGGGLKKKKGNGYSSKLVKKKINLKERKQTQVRRTSVPAVKNNEEIESFNNVLDRILAAEKPFAADVIRGEVVNNAGAVKLKQKVSYKLSSGQAAKVIGKIAADVLVNIKFQDYESLSEIVHPKYGLRLVANGYISNSNVILLKDAVSRISSSSRKKYMWSDNDFVGSDEEDKSQKASVFDAMKKYFYAFDYLSYNFTLFNDMYDVNYLGIDDPLLYYPFGISVKSLHPNKGGFSALRMIFEEYEGRWYLVCLLKENIKLV